MLVLSRDCNTVVHIGADIKVKVLSIRKRRVKLGIDAPSHIRVWRDEILPKSAPLDGSEDRGRNGPTDLEPAFVGKESSSQSKVLL